MGNTDKFGGCRRDNIGLQDAADAVVSLGPGDLHPEDGAGDIFIRLYKDRGIVFAVPVGQAASLGFKQHLLDGAHLVLEELLPVAAMSRALRSSLTCGSTWPDIRAAAVPSRME